MKRTLLLTALFSLFTLSAEVFESNALSFALNPKDSFEGSGYELVRGEGEEVLFLDGREVRRRTAFEDGFSVVENGVERRFRTDEDGRVVVEESGDGIRRNNYSDDGLLLSSSLSDGNEILEFSSYYYDTSSRLARIDTLSGVYVFDDDMFYFSSDGSDYRVRDGYNILEPLESEIEMASDGSINIRESDGVLRRYSADGRIVREEKDGTVTTYSYLDDGTLSSQITSNGEDEVIRRYESSHLSNVEYYSNGILLRRITYSDSSVDESRFRDGEVYAVIHYDMDGRTIRDIEVL